MTTTYTIGASTGPDETTTIVGNNGAEFITVGTVDADGNVQFAGDTTVFAFGGNDDVRTGSGQDVL